MRVLHLSDTHLPAAAGPDEDGVDARAVLTGLLHDCRHLTEIDVVIVSGDIADDGSLEGYRDALAAVQAYARSKNAATVLCVGNHDERSGVERPAKVCRQTIIYPGRRARVNVVATSRFGCRFIR